LKQYISYKFTRLRLMSIMILVSSDSLKQEFHK